MTSAAILTLMMAVFALAIKPGAGMVMVMSKTISHGLGGCFAFLVGFNAALLFYLVLVLGGLQFVNLDLVFLSILIKSLAALYLIWTGVKGLQGNLNDVVIEKQEAQTFVDNIGSSFMLTLSNPLIIVFYAGILPTILPSMDVTLSIAMLIAFIVLGIETFVVLLYCVPLALFRTKIPLNLLQNIRVFSSLVLICIGLYIGYTAIGATDITSVF